MVPRRYESNRRNRKDIITRHRDLDKLNLELREVELYEVCDDENQKLKLWCDRESKVVCK